MSLSETRLRGELARFTYRPGWVLSIEVDPIEGPCLWIVATVPDAAHPDAEVPLRIRSLIPPMADYDTFGRWLLWRLTVVEIHEAQEWCRRDGMPVSDPHRARMPPDA